MKDDDFPPGLQGAEFEAALAIAPFHKWLGLRVVSVGKNELVLEMPWRDEIISNPMRQSAHGGVLASLIDLAGLYVVLTHTRAVTATASLHVDYHRTAKPGPITVRATLVKLGKTLSVAQTELFDKNGSILASGRGSYLMERF